MASLQEITDKLRAVVAASPPIGRTLKLDLRGEGMVFIDGTEVSNDDRPADLTVTAAADVMESLWRGQLDPMTAVMTGRLKLSDMGLAMQLQPRLQALFGGAR